jgi:hypothetical protein
MIQASAAGGGLDFKWVFKIQLVVDPKPYIVLGFVLEEM